MGIDGGDTLLYVELQGKGIYGAIVHDRGKFVEYREFHQSLLKPVIALWRQPPKDKRWVAFKYVIEGKHFRFEAAYPEEMGPPDGLKDRVVRATIDKFGRKPVHHIEPEAPATH